jgi:YfiH family protein
MFFTYNSLNKYTEIAHFCTDRIGGASVGNFASFNMSPFSGDNPDDYNKNKSTISAWLGIDSDKIIIPYQTHGTEILEIDSSFIKLTDKDKIQSLYGIDALITKLPGVCIGITTADCVPLIFFDPQKQAIAVAHAGWRGTCGRIGEKTIQALMNRYQCNPDDIRVVIGPSISAKVYEIGKEVIDQFEQSGFDNSVLITIRNNSYYLDLWKANRLTLENAGVKPWNIETSGICTFTEHERFFSARRLGIKSGRMMSGIMLIG